MTSWHYDLARDKYTTHIVPFTAVVFMAVRKEKDIGGKKYTVFCLEVSDAKSR